jgi:hypothetical protein
MNATADSQERWHRFYEEAALKSADQRLEVERLMKRVESRRLWDRILMVGSTMALVALTSFFYSVLTR